MGGPQWPIWTTLPTLVLIWGCQECPPDLSGDLAQLTEENAALREEIAALKETPAMKLRASAEAAAQARDRNDLDAMNRALPRLQELLAMYPDDPEAHAAKAVLDSTETVAEASQELADARREIDDAVSQQDYRSAKKVIKRHTAAFGDEETARLNKKVRDAEFAPVEITVKQLEYLGQDYVGKRVKMTCQFRGLQDIWITDLPGVKGVAHPVSWTQSFTTRPLHTGRPLSPALG